MPKQNIEEFYSFFDHNIRMILDDLSGTIFEQYPNIKEKIQKQTLNYTDAKQGKIIEIKPDYNKVEIIFLKQGTSITYKKSEEINFKELKLFMTK